MTEEKLCSYVEREIRKHGSARVSAMRVFNICEDNLTHSFHFSDFLQGLAQRQRWDIYPIGELPFGELLVLPEGSPLSSGDNQAAVTCSKNT